MRRHARHRDSRGLALIETAIALPVLLLLVLGAVESGFALRDANILSRATEQAARADTRLAVDPLADYEALRALESTLSSTSASTVKRVIVYKANATGDSPPAACLAVARPDTTAPAGVAGLCNVYSRTQVFTDAPGQFGSCSGTWDASFCPASRLRTGTSPDRIGVYVEMSYDKITRVLPGGVTLRETAVFQVEPCVAGDPTC